MVMDNQDGISRSIVDAPPAHYAVKIQSFSLMTKNSIERYESGNFEAGGYKWKLVLYPSGNKSMNVKDHISLYLALDEASSLHHGWEVYVNFRLFLHDQNNDNYLVVQDAARKERRFHKMKVEWGFDQFIPLKDFNLISKGYLVGDTCAIGAEVFVCNERSTGKGECLVMMKDAITYKHQGEFDNFSKLDSEYYESKAFNAGNYKWKIKLYPNGKGAEVGSYISLYLVLANPSALSPSSKIYAQIILRILDQKQAKHHFGKANYWFSASNHENGASRFMSISNFTNQYSGYLVKDSCLAEAEVTILGVVDALS
ncbi:TNF receptor-associated factor homolog 1a [Abrus precatorius]|uniref:TNF receptor-associated factor homolog 1a n=1 Tax=Abrus precatorius TaxID=3816 RepID=A0A8B8JNT5_ABRPR|nr:TNF receptor-associated factor homolog 1a [Abrus precatorius]